MSDTEEKKHDASDRKLRKKRQEGSIPNSQDSTGMFGTAIGIITCMALAVPMWLSMIEQINATPSLFTIPFDEAVETGMNVMFDVIWLTVLPVVGAVLSLSIVITLVINKGFVFAMKPVTPDLKRVSISAGFKRIFGKRAWVELGVATLRLFTWLLFATVAAILLLPDIIKTVECSMQCQFGIVSLLIRTIVIGAILFLIVAAIADIVIQRDTFLEEQKMTDTEKKRERKDQAVSEQVLQERNRIQQLINSTAGVKLTSGDSTIVFRAAQGMVGINYNPPEQPLPLISVKAKTNEQRAALTRQMEAQGIPILDNERIVLNTIGKGQSEMLDVTYFRDFALALASR